MKKIIIFISICLLAILPMGVLAQVDGVDSDKRVLPTQVPLEQCDWVDTCEVTRYAIVCKNKKYGIYDLLEHKNLTEIELSALRYSYYVINEDSMVMCYFSAEKGIQRGTIGVVGQETVAVWMDNPDLICSLDECTTIDNSITDKCRKELKIAMEQLNGTYGQLAVVDAQNGQLKAWVASKKDGKEVTDANLLRSSCSTYSLRPAVIAGIFGKSDLTLEDSVDTGSGVLNYGDTLIVRDHNWRTGGYGKITYRQGFVMKSEVAMLKSLCCKYEQKGIESWKGINSNELLTEAMSLASIVHSIYKGDKLMVPSLIGDSIIVSDELPFTPIMHSNIRQILVETNVNDGIQAKYAPKGVALAGLYGNTENESGQRELSFAGCFPADSPRYAIGIFIDKESEGEASSAQLSSVVNTMIEWLTDSPRH